MSQKATEIFPGCKIIDTSAGKIMVGAPSDILKTLLRRGIEVPDKVILPDIFWSYGTVQANLEFLLYYNVFVRKNKNPLVLVGDIKGLQRAHEILRLSLFGPSDTEMKAWGIPEPIAKRQLAIGEYLGIKINGRLARVDDLVSLELMDNGEAEIGGIVIQRVDANVFKFIDKNEETLVDINLAGPQMPPIPIVPPRTLVPRPVFGATTLSKCASGFDPSGYTTAIVVWVNGLGISIDGASWMKEHLASCGISPKEIEAHIITHIHDDHSNIIDLIVNGKPFVLISDRLNYEMLVLKVAAILDLDANKVKEMIRFLEVAPDSPLDWYGARIEIWPTAHPIPTFGVKITAAGKSICYSSDTLAGQKLAALRNTGAIPQAFCDAIRKNPLSADLVFHDIGGGAIHPDASDLILLLTAARGKIVPTHLAKIPDELAAELDPPEAGKTWELVPQKNLNAGNVLQILAAPIVKNLSDQWKSVVISRAEIYDFVPGQTIIQEGMAGTHFYTIIAGTAEVLHNSETIAALSAGDFFGEMSLMYKAPANATIRAKSAIKIMALPREIFLKIADETGLGESLSAIHRMRPLLLRFPTLRSLPINIQQEIYKRAALREIPAGEVIFRKGDSGDCLYGIADGIIDVLSGGKALATLYRGHLFGEMAILDKGVRSADIRAQTDVLLLVLCRKDTEELMRASPHFRYNLEMLATSRK